MLPTIDFSSKIPLYIQIADTLISFIQSGKLKSGVLFPTEIYLCQKYQVSRSTIRQAMGLLVQENYIYRKRGKGTYIQERIIEQKLVKCYSFTEVMKESGKKPRSIILRLEKYPADSILAHLFHCDLGTLLWLVERIRYADDIPVLLQKEYFLAIHFPHLDNFLYDNVSLYLFLAQKYGIIFDSAEEVLKPIYLSKNDSKLLEITTNSLGMQLERIVYCQEKMFGYSHVIARGDKFIYKINF